MPAPRTSLVLSNRAAPELHRPNGEARGDRMTMWLSVHLTQYPFAICSVLLLMLLLGTVQLFKPVNRLGRRPWRSRR